MRKEIKLRGEVRAKGYDRCGTKEGIILYNEKGENVAFGFDKPNGCYGDLDPQYWGDNLLNDNVISNCGAIIIFDLFEDQDLWDCGAMALLTIITRDIAYSYWVSNDQNGYYDHSVFLQENGEYTYDTWI